jgi:hypothetical protein
MMGILGDFSLITSATTGQAANQLFAFFLC